MYSTTAYLYQQKQQVLLLDSSGAYFDRRWQPVYAKNLKINRGVDNVILFEFINQDQKPVNISGSTITFGLISQDGTESLLRKDLVALNATYGRAKVTITEEELDVIDAQRASWSLERGSGDLWEAVFVDDYAGGRGDCDIVDSVYPDFVPSQELIVPSYQVPQPDNPNRPTTSAIYTEGRDYHSFQFDFRNGGSGFSGVVKAQAADTQLGPWYDIENTSHVWDNQMERYILSVPGNYHWMRWEINQYGSGATASVTVNESYVIGSVSIDAPGKDFLIGNVAHIDISGQGADANVYATVENGQVTGAVVVNPGQDYYGATPTVTIDVGHIERITYR
jgi:hypothetical protein